MSNYNKTYIEANPANYYVQVLNNNYCLMNNPLKNLFKNFPNIKYKNNIFGDTEIDLSNLTPEEKNKLINFVEDYSN